MQKNTNCYQGAATAEKINTDTMVLVFLFKLERKLSLYVINLTLINEKFNRKYLKKNNENISELIKLSV